MYGGRNTWDVTGSLLREEELREMIPCIMASKIRYLEFGNRFVDHDFTRE
jgi:hypothetical protein